MRLLPPSAGSVYRRTDPMHPGSSNSGASSTFDHVAPPSALTHVFRTAFPAHRRTLNRTEPSLNSTNWASFTVLVVLPPVASVSPPGATSPIFHVLPPSSLYTV